MAYAPIAKIEKFTSEENDAQSLNIRPQTFQEFKTAFLGYFNNNNSINNLANTFTTIKQEETEAVTIYLGHFYRNLHQIQAIDANYFTASQILNQFIRGLCSSILQHVYLDFESAKSEANHVQIINLVMNGLSELDSKLKQFSDSINQKLEGYLADNCLIYQFPQQCNNQRNTNHFQNHHDNKKLKFATTVVNKVILEPIIMFILPIQPSPISTNLPVNNATANISITYILISSLSTTATNNISTTTAPNNLSNTYTVRIITAEFRNQVYSKPEFSELFKSSGYLQRRLTQHTETQTEAITYQYSASHFIFPFKIEEPTETPLFSGSALKKKPIMAMYTDAKINEINGITVPIKVLVMKATQYQALMGNNWLSKINATLDWNTQELQLSQNEQHTCVPAMFSWVDEDHNKLPLILSWDDKKKKKENKELTWNTDQNWKTDNNQDEPANWEWKEIDKRKRKEKEEETTLTSSTYSSYTYILVPLSNYCQPKLECIDCGKKLLSMSTCYGDDKKYSMSTLDDQNNKKSGITNHVLHVELSYLTKKCGMTFLGMEECVIRHAMLQQLEEYSHNKDELWRMAYAKTEDATTSELLEIKNNSLSFPEPKYIQTFDERTEAAFRAYCNECDLIYNLPPHIIYTIPEEDKPISNCASESESTFNPNSNSDNDDDKNNSSSSTLNSHEIYDDSNFNSNPKTFIALPDLIKEQELKWFSNNSKGIMSEHMHSTDAKFDLRYPEKDAIKLEPHLSSLAKRGINIRGGIINTGYVGNIIAMLQNNSEKTYIIEPNKKIAQTIFLQKLGITVRGIQKFGSTSRIEVPVNMAEEKIFGQGEIISTSQVISIPSYDQYMIVIERKMKDKDQIFEAETSFCESEEIGLINLYILAKNHNHIKIPIYNTTGDAITIPERTIIRYISTELENQPPSIIPDFPQLCKYVDITSQTIYRQKECYLLQPEQLEQMNIGNLDPLQCIQFKMLLNNFNDIFTNKNKFSRTDIIQY
ncbi:hypothetical protein G9A89_020234 [Geosiphon pyriformis]|nr:hypothetical protein G9A89_020234 [Geosiphon pyriformis]